MGTEEHLVIDRTLSEHKFDEGQDLIARKNVRSERPEGEGQFVLCDLYNKVPVFFSMSID